jgi:hypothetical protein
MATVMMAARSALARGEENMGAIQWRKKWIRSAACTPNVRVRACCATRKNGAALEVSI